MMNNLNSRRLCYPGGVRDDKTRFYVPPVRVVRQSDGVTGADVLLRKVNIQSYCHFAPPGCVIPPGGELILDFGVELHGLLTLNTGTMESRPSRMRITLGESVSETLGTPTPDHAVHQLEDFPIPMLGQVNFGYSAFRFVRLEVPHDAPNTVELSGVCVTAVFHDWEYAGWFESDDERLNRIWKTGAYTAHLNCQDYIYDGVKRDRLVWQGDLYPEIRTLLAVFQESSLIEKSLDFVRDRTPEGGWMNGISSYSCWWVISHWELYRHRGSRDYLEAQHEPLRRLLLQLLGYVNRETGAEELGEVRFLDWSTNHDEKIKHAGLQGLLAWTLEYGALLMEELEEADIAARCRKALPLLRTCAPDCRGNKIAAAMQILGGVGDGSKLDREILRRNPDRNISTFYGYFVLLAKAKAGDIAGALEVIRNYWGAMLDFGATTFWEDFDLDWTENAFGIDQLPVPGKRDIHADFGKYCYCGLRHSLCHGWAGGPTAFLTEHVLGIQPLAPGFREVRIQPALCGLKKLDGAIPTPYGPIEVSFRAEHDGNVRRSVKLPEGVREEHA